jgi:hypothetical protein
MHARFVQLSYSIDSKGEPGVGIPLLLFHDHDELRIAVPDGWERGMAPLHREYLAEMIADWKQLSIEDVKPTLDQLSEFSTGPLKVVASGTETMERLAAMAISIKEGRAHVTP